MTCIKDFKHSEVMSYFVVRGTLLDMLLTGLQCMCDGELGYLACSGCFPPCFLRGESCHSVDR